MLAYIFWHRPDAAVPAGLYESALVEFHKALLDVSCPGFLGSALYRISESPWLGRAGYADWYFVEASWALDPLNSAAVSGPMSRLHAQAAHHMEIGHGGLYRLLHGEHRPDPDSRVAWLSRPRGIQYGDTLTQMVEAAGRPAACWRRQMVLGPAPELAIAGDRSLALSLPEGWKAVTVDRTLLWHAPGW